MSCLFCEIVEKKRPSHLIYEDEFIFSVLDVFPRTKGHTLVLPKKHGETILDFSDEELGNIFSGVRKVTNILKLKLNPDGFTIGINHGKVSGQSIDHLHIHILPRFKEDKGGSIHSVVDFPPKEDLEEIRKMIVGN